MNTDDEQEYEAGMEIEDEEEFEAEIVSDNEGEVGIETGDDELELPPSMTMEGSPWLTEVRDQEDCCACWGFTATAAVATEFARLNNCSPVLLSVQHMLETVTYNKTDRAEKCCLTNCLPFDPHRALCHIMDKGVVADTVRPYKGRRPEKADLPKGIFEVMRITAIGCIYDDPLEYDEGERDLYGENPNWRKAKEVLFDGTPLIGILDTGPGFSHVKGETVYHGERPGVHDNPANYSCHAVLLVGYKTINGENSFHVQDSNGKTSGNDGFLYVHFESITKVIYPVGPYLDYRYIRSDTKNMLIKKSEKRKERSYTWKSRKDARKMKKAAQIKSNEEVREKRKRDKLIEYLLNELHKLEVEEWIRVNEEEEEEEERRIRRRRRTRIRRRRRRLWGFMRWWSI